MDLGRELSRDGGVIIAGDWNVSRTARDTYPRLRTEGPHAQARTELNARIAADGFADIWRERHPEERKYTWFNRRARGLDAARVDFILVSGDLVPRVVDADILDLMPWSDHAPIRVELKSRSARASTASGER
jgi:exodeoxyribonuclease-3